jgi:type I restriction enzyme S subunit
MEVRAGYKQTEVGVIPENWDAKKMGDVINRCFSGATPRRNRPEFYRGDIRWITSGELNYNVITDTVEKITHDAVRETNLAIVPAGTFLMAITGLEAEGTRGACGIVGASATTNQSCMAVLPTEALLTEYLFHYYVFRGKQLALQYCQGTKQQSYTAKLVKQLPIALPSAISEQRAISSALSDVDELLDSIDHLIAKKRDLKQAAMQQLLTGQVRLLGFSGEWEEKRLGDLGSTYGGLTGKTKADFGNGDARYITFMNVMQNVVIDCESFDRVDVSQQETQNHAKRGDLFFNGSSETPEEVALCAVLLEEVQNVYLNSFCFGFRFREDIAANGIFFAYYLRGPVGRELMKSLAQGSTRYNMSKVALLNSLLLLPTHPEQTAIAEVLTGMDAELVALEKQRNKTLALKQGMMQELLTGRTRLV